MDAATYESLAAAAGRLGFDTTRLVPHPAVRALTALPSLPGLLTGTAN